MDSIEALITIEEQPATMACHMCHTDDHISLRGQQGETTGCSYSIPATELKEMKRGGGALEVDSERACALHHFSRLDPVRRRVAQVEISKHCSSGQRVVIVHHNCRDKQAKGNFSDSIVRLFDCDDNKSDLGIYRRSNQLPTLILRLPSSQSKLLLHSRHDIVSLAYCLAWEAFP